MTAQSADKLNYRPLVLDLLCLTWHFQFLVPFLELYTHVSPPDWPSQVGGLSLKAVHYGTSQSACGSLFQLSCGTVDGDLYMTLQFPHPVVSRPMARAYLKGVADCLRAGCGVTPKAQAISG